MNGETVAILESRLGTQVAELIAKRGGKPLHAPALTEVPDVHPEQISDLLRDWRSMPVKAAVFQTGVGTRALFKATDDLDLTPTLLTLLAATTVNELLDGHVILDVECLDRMYLNAYVPKLQVSGRVVGFMTRLLGLPIPSPAVMEKIGTSFRRAVHTFAAAHRVPIVKFGKLDRKAEVMQPYLQRQAATGIPGVAAIGMAQEYQNVFACSERVDRVYTGHRVWFTFHKADRRVTCFYFYLWDAEFGPGFIKICAYFPYPAKVWLL
jgi:hypothetical protein